MSEWIRLHRDFFDLDWFDKPELLALFMLMLKSASNKECERGGVKLHRGQLVTSFGILSKQTKLSTRTLRTCISRLKEWNLIQTDTCNRHSVVTIVNYDEYETKEANALPQSQSTEVITEDKQPKSKEPEKPKKTKEELVADTQKRKKKFYDELVPYVETYGRDMIRNFYNYWSEENKSGSRMRFEQERTWNLNLRLQRWGRQNTTYGSKSSSTALHDSENKNYNEGLW